MEWFKNIPEFKEGFTDKWNYDGSVLISLEAWKDKDELETHLEAVYKDLGVA